MHKIEIVRTTFNKRLKRATVTVKEQYGSGPVVTYKVRIEPLQESFEQYGAPLEILYKTLPIANKLVRNKFKSL